MKKAFQNNWPLLLLILLSGLIVWPLFMPGYFFQHDGLQIIRIFEMRRCFVDLQLPCRWVPDMGYGNGYPLFNFYGVLPYYFGAVASFLLGYIGAAKFMFFLPLFFGGIGMYFLAKELFGKVPGFVAAVLFLFAPYRAVDVYVRGAVGESFGIALIPFVFYFFLKLIRTKERKYFAITAITTAAFLVSHNIMTMIFTPIIIVWVIFWLWQEKWKGVRITLEALFLSFGLSAFFLLPAFLEKGLVRTDTLIREYYDFRSHFAAVFQLFTDRFWGIGGSVPGIEDKLSFQIGWPHWWLVAGAAILVLFKKGKNRLLAVLLMFIFGASVFMIHNQSSFIWERIKILAYVQFPWRFLSIVIVAASLLGGYFVSIYKGKLLYILSVIIVTATIALNWTYFTPGIFHYDSTDQKEMTGQNWVNQKAGAVQDYLPRTALEPKELAPSLPLIISGVAEPSNFVNKSNRWSFDIRVTSEALVDVPVLDFPKWTVQVDGKTVSHLISDPSGRIEIKIPEGEHKVTGQLKNSPIREFANILSLLSLLGIVFFYKYGKSTKIYS